MATRLRIELEDATRQGLQQLKKNLESFASGASKDIAPLLESFDRLAATISNAARGVGSVGLDSSKLTAAVDEVTDQLAKLSGQAATLKVGVTVDMAAVERLKTAVQDLADNIPPLRLSVVVDDAQIAELHERLSKLPAVNLQINFPNQQALESALERIREKAESVPPVTVNADAAPVEAASDAVDDLKTKAADVPPITVEADPAPVREATDEAKRLSDVIANLPPLTLDNIGRTLQQVDELSAKAANVSFDGSADDLKRLAREAQNANQVVGDLFQQRTQVDIAIRQIRASAEAIEATGDSSAEAKAKLKDLAEQEERALAMLSLLQAAMRQASDSALKLGAAASKAAGGVTDAEEDISALADQINRMNRVAEKNALRVIANDARAARTELRVAAGGAADFITAVDRAGKAAGGMRTPGQLLGNAFGEITQAVAVNSVVGNSLVNTLQRIGGSAIGGAGAFGIAAKAVTALYGAFGVANAAGKRTRENMEDLRRELGDLAAEFYTSTQAADGFFSALEADVAGKQAGGLGVFLQSLRGMKDDFAAMFDLLADNQGMKNLADNIQLIKQNLFAVTDEEIKAAKAADEAQRLASLRLTVEKKIAEELQGQHVASIQTIEEARAKLEAAERTLVKAQDRGDEEHAKKAAVFIEQLAKRIIELNKEKAQAEDRIRKERIEKEKRAADEEIRIRTDATKRTAQALGRFEADIAKERQTELDKLRETRERMAAFGADETTQLREQAGIIEFLTAQYERQRAVVAAMREEFQQVADDSRLGADALATRAASIEEAQKQFAATAAELERERQHAAKLTTSLEKQALDQHLKGLRERGDRLKDIATLERQAIEAAARGKLTVDDRIASETQLNQLLAQRESLLQRTAADSAEAQQANASVIGEFNRELSESTTKARTLADHLRRLEDAGLGTSGQAKATRTELEQTVELVRTLRERLDQFKRSTGSEIAAAQTKALEAKIASIEEFLQRQQQQTGRSPLAAIANRITDQDVSRTIGKRQQAEFERRQAEAREQLQRQLAQEGVSTSVGPGGKLRAGHVDDQRDVARREQAMIQQIRREVFQRPDEAAKLDTRAELTQRLIDGLAQNGQIDQATQEALKSQLEKTVEGIRSQVELKQSIDGLTRAMSSQAMNKAKRDAIAAPAAQQPIGQPAAMPVAQPQPNAPAAMPAYDVGALGPRSNAVPAGQPSGVLQGAAALAQSGGQLAQATARLGQTAVNGFQSLAQGQTALAEELRAHSQTIAALVQDSAQRTIQAVSTSQSVRQRALRSFQGHG